MFVFIIIIFIMNRLISKNNFINIKWGLTKNSSKKNIKIIDEDYNETIDIKGDKTIEIDSNKIIKVGSHKTIENNKNDKLYVIDIIMCEKCCTPFDPVDEDLNNRVDINNCRYCKSNMVNVIK